MLRRLTQEIDYDSIISNLYTIVDYGFEEKPQCFYLYEETMPDLATYASDLISTFEKPSYRVNKTSLYCGYTWNIVIAAMDDISLKTLKAIEGEIEIEIYDEFEIEQIKKGHRSTLEKFTKSEVMDLMVWVNSMLVKYFEAKTAYDVIVSVLDELEQNNSALVKNGRLELPKEAEVF